MVHVLVVLLMKLFSNYAVLEHIFNLDLFLYFSCRGSLLEDQRSTILSLVLYLRLFKCFGNGLLIILGVHNIDEALRDRVSCGTLKTCM